LPLVLLAGLALVALTGCVSAPSDPSSGPFDPDALDDVSGSTEPTVGGEGNLTIHFVDVGQGDGIAVHFPNRTVVVDTGRWSGPEETAVRDHLRADGVDPDALVLTHPDADHSGGCDEVLAAFDVDTVYHPGTRKDTQTWRDCEQAIAGEGARERTDEDLDPGNALDWSNQAHVELLHIDGSAHEDPNEGSIAVEIRFGSFAAILTGDIGCEAERAILARGLVGDIDVLQVGHHGSGGSTCDAWLDRTRPEAAIVSVGADNRYGHPAGEVLERLQAHDATLHRTDRLGTIHVETNGTAWQLAGQPARGADDPAEPSDQNLTRENASIEIQHVQADAPGNDHESLDEEFVELANPSNRTVDVAGWQLSDRAGYTYTLDNATIPPNGTLRVHTGHGEDNATHVYWGRDSAVWNNDGDRVELVDARGRLVDAFEY